MEDPVSPEVNHQLQSLDALRGAPGRRIVNLLELTFEREYSACWLLLIDLVASSALAEVVSRGA